MTKKIWWDPGHGGADPGAVGNGLRESDLTLKIVKYAMAYLDVNHSGFEQRATRLTDITVDLSKRDDGPDAWGADVFVSAHINASGGTGFESFIYNSASAASIALQNVLHPEILAAMRQFGSITDRGKKRGNLFVVRETNAPAILTENLFIDTTADATKLKNEAFIKAVGEAHARGVAKFLGLPQKAVQGGWQQNGGKWYYYKNGVMVKNDWAQDSKRLWYYLDNNGQMATSKWVLWKNKWYYLKEDGSMATGEITVKGKPYFLRSDGSLLITDKDGVIQ